MDKQRCDNFFKLHISCIHLPAGVFIYPPPPFKTYYVPHFTVRYGNGTSAISVPPECTLFFHRLTHFVENSETQKLWMENTGAVDLTKQLKYGTGSYGTYCTYTDARKMLL